MKTVLDTSVLCTGAFCLWKNSASLISDLVSFGEIDRKQGFWRGLLGCTREDVPSHTDIVLIKDNGLIESRGMSWPADVQGRYYYEQELGADEVKFISAVAVWPALQKFPVLQYKVADWLHGQDKMGYVYGIENLIRDLENKPTDVKRPVCAMFGTFLLEYFAFLVKAFPELRLAPVPIPTDWVNSNEMGCDDQLQWFKQQGWIVPHLKQVDDDVNPQEEIIAPLDKED